MNIFTDLRTALLISLLMFSQVLSQDSVDSSVVNLNKEKTISSSFMTKNMLLGIAVGDAFGMGIEMKDRKWIAQNIDFSKYVCDRKFRTPAFEQGYTIGDYTDDTSDSIAVINTLMKYILLNQPFSEENLLSEIRIQYDLSKETRNGCPRAGYGSIDQYFDGKKTLEEVKNYQRNKVYPGNAPPMRAVPIGLMNKDLINTFALVNADVSHPHPKAEAASILVAQAARYMLIEKGAQIDIIKHCKEFIRDIDEETYAYLSDIDMLANNIDELTETPSPEFERLVGPQPAVLNETLVFEGLNVDAMRTAGTMLYILKHSESTFEAFRRAILIGGDVDSLAAIVTGIMGGRFGLDDLPEFLVEGVEGRERIKELAHQFANALENQ